MANMNLCSTLWKSQDELKQAYADAEKFLKEGKNLSLAEYQQAIDKLSKAKEEYNNSLYTKLPDGRKIYALDYLSLIKLCDSNVIDFEFLIRNQPDEFLREGRIIKLDIQALCIADIKHVSELTKLEWFNCVSTSESDLTSLTNLKNLKWLDCSYTQISDISPLSHLSNLQELRCKNTRISTISSLANLKQLKYLDCSNTGVSDPTPLAGLEYLENLNLSKTKILTIESLKMLNNLKMLDIEETAVSDASSLIGLKKLVDFHCSHTKISDLTALSHIPFIDAASCPLTNESKELAKLKKWSLL